MMECTDCVGPDMRRFKCCCFPVFWPRRPRSRTPPRTDTGTGLRSVHLPTGGAGGAPRIWALLCLLGYTLLKCLYSSGGGRSSIGWKLNFDSKSSRLDLDRLEWPECPLRMGGGGGGGPAGVLELREELELEDGGGGGLPMRPWGSEL